MPKRQKHKHHRAKGAPQSRAGLGPEAWRAHIEALLARGQTREAVEAAKQYLKEAPRSRGLRPWRWKPTRPVSRP